MHVYTWLYNFIKKMNIILRVRSRVINTLLIVSSAVRAYILGNNVFRQMNILYISVCGHIAIIFTHSM